ncbi:MAG: GAF domain-containing sensor histidine kinase [Chloroflexota bacterium]
MARATSPNQSRGPKGSGKPERLRHAIGQVALEVSRGPDWDQILKAALQVAESALEADAVALWRAEPEGGLLLVSHRHLPETALAPIRRIPYDAPYLAAKAAREDRLQVIEKLEQLPPDYPITHLWVSMGFQSLVALPLRARGRLAGAMVYYSRSQRYYEREELEALATIAEILGLGLENALLHDSLHEMQEQQQDLVRMVSHDLRSPLTAVQGQAQLLLRMLERSGQDGRLRQSADAIYTGARRMNVMIQDLVDMARVEIRQLKVNRTAMQMGPFLTNLKQRLAEVLDTERVHIDIPEGLPPVWADPDRLERALTNLLSNALKYSQPDTDVPVTAWATNREVVVSVTDRGPGIPPEELGQLFQRRYRARGARKAEGLGLGLYITRMLVEAMGGRIWAESEVGQGSSFSFTLPRVE